MALKIKNIIIFLVIATIFVLIYVFFIKKAPNTVTLVSSSASSIVPSTTDSDKNSLVAKEFLSLLLSVKNIKLDDTIFSDNAFVSLHDSSIVLVPDGNEGRPNPFAMFGSENIAPLTNTPKTNTQIPLTP